MLLASSSLLAIRAEEQVEKPLEEGELLAEASETYGKQVAYEKPKTEYASTPAYTAQAYDTASKYAAAAPYDQTGESSVAYGKPQVYGQAPLTYAKPNSTYDPYTSYSPWRAAPGGYTKASYGGARYENRKHPYNSASIYASYLTSGPYNAYSKQCSRAYGSVPKISYEHLNLAFQHAHHELNEYTRYEVNQYKAGNYMNASHLSSQARHQIGSHKASERAPIHIKEKEALFMEMASKYLMKQ